LSIYIARNNGVDMKTINEHIEAKQIKQFYLLFGSEDYLKTQYRDKLVKALVEPDDNMNYNYYEGNQVQVETVFDIADTMPFFSDSRVIVVENSGWMKKCPDDLEKRLERVPESTHIIFVEKEVDKRNRLYKWIGKQGYASEMDTPDEKMLLAWVKGLCKSEGKQIDDEAIFYLVEHMGTDMLLLKNELDKLFSYTADQNVIRVEDVKEVCVGQASEKMFDMLDAIGNKNQEKALLLYRDLLALREPAMKILFLIARHYNILMQIAKLKAEGKDNKSLASLCGIPPFSVKKYASQADRYSYDRLRSMVEKCQQTDQGVKTGQVTDVVGVELLIVEFSSK